MKKLAPVLAAALLLLLAVVPFRTARFGEARGEVPNAAAFTPRQRISVGDYPAGIRFYRQLLLNAAGG